MNITEEAKQATWDEHRQHAREIRGLPRIRDEGHYVQQLLDSKLSDAQKTIEQLREENKELLKVHAICETLTRELQAARNQLKDANEHIEKHHAEERRRRSSFNL